MGQIKNPLHAIILRHGVTKLSRELKVSAVSVARWCRLGYIPAKHLTNFANALDLELSEVIQFAVKDGPIKDDYDNDTIPKPENTLDTLIEVKKGNLTPKEAARQLKLSEHSIKLTMKRNEDRLEVLREVLYGWADGTVSGKQACDRLGVTKPELSYLARIYGVKLRRQRKAKVEPGRYTTNRPKYLEAALDVIRGTDMAVSVAKERNLALRTLHRYIKDFIDPLGLNELSHWPTSFRLAYAEDLKKGNQSPVMKWLETLEKHEIPIKRAVKYPKSVENWRKASIRRMLVAILTGELNIRELAELRGGAVEPLKKLFDAALKPFSMSYSAVMSMGVHHQVAVAEMLLMSSVEPDEV